MWDWTDLGFPSTNRANVLGYVINDQVTIPNQDNYLQITGNPLCRIRQTYSATSRESLLPSGYRTGVNCANHCAGFEQHYYTIPLGNEKGSRNSLNDW